MKEDKKKSEETPLNETQEEVTTPAEPAPAKVAELEAKITRLYADFENAKKNIERDKWEAIKFANEKLLAEILPVVDNFDRAMVSLSEGHGAEKVKTGLRLAQEELHQILEKHGVQVVKSLGEPFDPRFHEAVAMVESQDVEEGNVVDEIQRGYTLNGRLIRPSRVRIASKKIHE